VQPQGQAALVPLNLQHLSRVCQRGLARQGSGAAQGPIPHTSYVPNTGHSAAVGNSPQRAWPLLMEVGKPSRLGGVTHSRCVACNLQLALPVVFLVLRLALVVQG
jgi:hypothetical protein